jgi:transcriptional regulator GlxA family with amidase domain
MRRVFFLILPHTHLLDLAGPAQVFWEASGLGGAYEVRYCASSDTLRTAQGLVLASLETLPEVDAGDTVLVPGIESSTVDDLNGAPVDWLCRAAGAGARLGSICTGAFVLAHAGILDGRRCTTHWKVTERLAREYPAAQVVRNRLFVQDGPVITSAGVASGIDMALAMVEEDFGPIPAARVAREIVVYLRRCGESAQTSVFLDFRTHLNPGIHRAQDWLASHLEERPTIGRIAGEAGMSPRNLTRLFRQATGITIKDYLTRLRLEVASGLLRSPDYTLERVALECGFRDARQLRRLWSKRFGINPSSWRTRDDVGRVPS